MLKTLCNAVEAKYILGVLTDKAAGDYTTETIYDDSNPDQIETLADTQFHRNVDLELLRADKEGNFPREYPVLCL